MSNILPHKKWKVDLDKDDELPLKEYFHIPRSDKGPKIYLCGHSLGLQPVKARDYLEEQLINWQNLGVEGHFRGETPWIHYPDQISRLMGKLVGARDHEVVVMNSLTVNIHLLLAGFYQPQGRRTKVIVESPSFPSDIQAVRSHLAVRGYGREHLIFWDLNPDTGYFEISDLKQLLEDQWAETALMFVSGLHYLNGQLSDIAGITRMAHDYGLVVGFDLAHAAGNVVLELHGWEVDFACWCTYKYLNGGPGSPGAIFIHERHHQEHHHFQGWWGHRLEDRFKMHPEFHPSRGAEAWQLSNPPILSLPSLKASLEIFDQIGMHRLQHKSRLLTGYLRDILEDLAGKDFRIITPSTPETGGAMLSLQFFHTDVQAILQELSTRGLVIDYREPNIIRVAPHPLYNSFDDCYHFAAGLRDALSG